MTGLTIGLLMLGCSFFVASFFIAEKLDNKELKSIGRLSEKELHIVLEHELTHARKELAEIFDKEKEEIVNQTEIQLEKESNEKIMSISEYSDTVIETMQKTHNEILFLYSMLSDKYAEVAEAKEEVVDKEEDSYSNEKPSQEEMVRKQNQMKIIPVEEKKEVFISNSNEDILGLYEQGVSVVDIAKKLDLGVGEVKLVVDLYDGEM